MRWVAISFIAALGIAAPSAVEAQDAMPSYLPTECTIPAGWDQIEKLEPDFVVFGENHGTAEAPMLVRDLICGLARRGERILLAVEFSPYYNSSWQAAWALPHAEFEAALIEHGWRGRIDGVGSEATLDLVMAAHLLKDQGAVISIVAFNGVGDEAQRERFADLPGQGPHEAAQAENIALAAQNGIFDRVIVLVGGLHAETRTTVGLGPSFEPMAMRLAGYGKVIALGMEHAGGSSWNCQLRSDFNHERGEPVRDKDVRCEAHPARRTAELDGEPFIALGVAPGSRMGFRHDGFFWVGPISASPPAIAE